MKNHANPPIANAAAHAGAELAAPSVSSATALQALRRAARQARRGLPPLVRRAEAKAAAAAFAQCLRLRAGQHVAFYAPLREEFPTAELMRLAWQRGCTVYLPVIAHRRLRLLRFAALPRPSATPQGRRPLTPNAMRRNALGIEEPATPRYQWRRARDLDLIAMPLVAFDAAGHRLGMGGGYYDRALAGTAGRRPWRLGLAHACQQLPCVPRRAWDMPLDAVLTAHGLRRF
jgi:5-formyltetrahydrofolate cyclo-ligase